MKLKVSFEYNSTFSNFQTAWTMVRILMARLLPKIKNLKIEELKEKVK